MRPWHGAVLILAALALAACQPFAAFHAGTFRVPLEQPATPSPARAAPAATAR